MGEDNIALLIIWNIKQVCITSVVRFYFKTNEI